VGLWQDLRHDIKPNARTDCQDGCRPTAGYATGQMQINTELHRVIHSNESLIKEQAITIKYQETVLSKVTLELALLKRLQFSKKQNH